MTVTLRLRMARDVGGWTVPTPDARDSATTKRRLQPRRHDSEPKTELRRGSPERALRKRHTGNWSKSSTMTQEEEDETPAGTAEDPTARWVQRVSTKSEPPASPSPGVPESSEAPGTRVPRASRPGDEQTYTFITISQQSTHIHTHTLRVKT